MGKLTTGVAAVIVVLIVIGLVAIAGVPGRGYAAHSSLSAGNWLTNNPDFVGNSSRIDYPPDYGALANFTLSVINRDRTSANVGPVTLSNVSSAQQHADSMAYFGYFSHWDTQGDKPYMRYTLLGGKGSVTENVARNYCNEPHPGSAQASPAACSLQTVENAINGSEWEMMHNDTTCCNGGHRGNILGRIHNRVSIGVAYNATTVYLVEDFEDSYVSSEILQLSANVVTFDGQILEGRGGWMENASGAEISVYYDSTPRSIQVGELSPSRACDQYKQVDEPVACQYQGAYTPGARVSTVFPPCPVNNTCAPGNYTFARSWLVKPDGFSIAFSMSELESAYGNGVYTFYLWPAASAPEPITSLSVFVENG